MPRASSFACNSASEDVAPALYHHIPSLPLVRDLEILPAIQRDPSSILLGADSTRLAVVLHKRNAPPSRHQPDLAEALEPSEHAGKSLHVGVVGEVLHEENLVRGEVLVGHDGGGGRARGLETGASLGLGRASGSLIGRGPLETLLLGLLSLLALCELLATVKSKAQCPSAGQL